MIKYGKNNNYYKIQWNGMIVYLGMSEYIIIYAIKIDVIFLFFIVSLYNKSFDFYKWKCIYIMDVLQ